MARGVNKVFLIGNLGSAPEVRFLPDGSPVANVNLATSESWNDRHTGERKEHTEWHRLVLFGKQAEVAENFLKKGSKVFVEGKLQTRTWEDQSGQKRYTTEIRAFDLQMLDAPPEGGDRRESYGGESYGAPTNGSSTTNSTAPAPEVIPPPPGDADDLPF